MRLGTMALLLLAGAVAVAGASCTARDGTSLSVAGSTSIQPFVEMLAEDYMARHPATRILVQGGGSTAGIQAVRQRVAVIGMVSRELHAEEQDLTPIVIARDGLAVIVHRSNPIGDLSTAQAKEIFAGGAKDFSQVGGKKGAIWPVTREEGSGTRGAFEELVMGGKPITPLALVQGSSGSVRELVSRNPDAIGYISLGLVDTSVKAVRIDGVDATRGNVKNGTYKLARPFLLIHTVELSGVAKEFVGFILSESGQRLLEQEGLISVK